MNSLDLYTSDDSTTRDFTVDIVNKKITFDAISGSYFYSNLACETATALGYNAITFPIQGPIEASFELELQTSEFCPMAGHSSYYYMVASKMTGNTLTVTVPLSEFTGANLNAIVSIVFGGFTPGIWAIGSTQLICANSLSNRVNDFATSSSQSPSVVTVTSSISSTTKISSSSSTAASSTALYVSSSSSSTLVTSTSRVSSSSKTAAASIPAGSCTSLLIDDPSLQSRLTVLCHNALLQPSSNDGTMRSVIVANDHVTLIPVDSKSYFYTSFGCINVTNTYGGIGLLISAPVHTVITAELRMSKLCIADYPTIIDVTSKELGWSFDGTEKFYIIPFAKCPAVDTDHLMSLRFSGLRNVVTLGSIAFYCRATGAY